MDLFERAAQQHGVFSIDQARVAGITRAALRHLLDRQVVERVRPGVYRVRAAPRTWLQDLSSATIWQPDALASHRAAASLWGLRGFEAAPLELVTERWARRGGQTDLLLHESKDLVAADIAERHGIACTSLVRTLVDLPAVVHEFKAGVALDQAIRTDPTVLGRVHDRHLEVARRGRNGTVALRALLAERGEGDQLVDSGFERKALRLLEGAGLPRPVTQHQVRDGAFRCYLDIAWPRGLLALECDSLEHHLGERAFRWERVRRRTLIRLGWTVLEYTYREVTAEGHRVVSDVRFHLEQRGLA